MLIQHMFIFFSSLSYKYNQHMMTDEEELRKQLETNVLYLENDEERQVILNYVTRNEYILIIIF
jgi:hypothetical protein